MFKSKETHLGFPEHLLNSFLFSLTSKLHNRSVCSTDRTLAEGCMQIASFMEECLCRVKRVFFFYDLNRTKYLGLRETYNMFTCELHLAL